MTKALMAANDDLHATVPTAMIERATADILAVLKSSVGGFRALIAQQAGGRTSPAKNDVEAARLVTASLEGVVKALHEGWRP